MKTKRILSRLLATELTPEELKVINGGTVVVAALESAGGDEGGSKPPLSTLVATLPDYSEDR